MKSTSTKNKPVSSTSISAKVSSWDEGEEENFENQLQSKGINNNLHLTKKRKKPSTFQENDDPLGKDTIEEYKEEEEDEFQKDHIFEYPFLYFRINQIEIKPSDFLELTNHYSNKFQKTTIQITYQKNALVFYHPKLTSLSDAQRAFKINKLSFKTEASAPASSHHPQYLLQSDGLKLSFQNPDHYYTLMEFVKEKKQHYDQTMHSSLKNRSSSIHSSASKQKKTPPVTANIAPLSFRSSLEGFNTLPKPPLQPANALSRYSSPIKSVSIVRNSAEKLLRPASTSKNSNTNNQIVHSPSPNKARGGESAKPSNNKIVPHRDFSPGSLQKNFREVNELTETVKAMTQRSFVPYQKESIVSNDDANDLLSHPKPVTPVKAFSPPKSIPRNERTPPRSVRTNWGVYAAGGQSASNMFDTKLNDSYHPIVEPHTSSAHKIPNSVTVSDIGEAIVKKKKTGNMTWSSIFSGKDSVRSSKPTLTMNDSVGSAAEIKSQSKLSLLEDQNSRENEDSWSDPILPLIDPTKFKPMNTYYKPASQSFSYINSVPTYSSLASSSFVKTVFKGGIRNLGNSCYMSTMMQCLLSIYDLMNDVNSEFWSNILESQLLLDTQSSSSENYALTEKVIFYNQNSCLSEFISLIQQKLKYDQENLNKAIYVPTTTSILPGAKDIFDLSNLKRVFGKLVPQFANYSQQDAQEFLMSLINQLEDEMSARFQYFLTVVSKKVPLTGSMKSSSLLSSKETVSKSRSNKENEVQLMSDVKDFNEFMISPSSISHLPKTEQKDKALCQTIIIDDDDDLQLSQKTGQKLLPEDQSWTNSQYLQKLSQELAPTRYYLENLVEIQMKCMSCLTELPPKYEHYRDFSLDLDTIPEEAIKILPQDEGRMDVEEKEEPATNADETKKEAAEGSATSKRGEKIEISLDLLLNNFFQAEICDWQCSHCHAYCQVNIRRRIVHLSKVVIIHLKRFRYSIQTNSLAKIDRNVSFRLSYDLSAFMRDAPTPSSSLKEKEEEGDSSNTAPTDPATVKVQMKEKEKEKNLDGKYHHLWNKLPTTLLDTKDSKEILSYLNDVAAVYEEVEGLHSPHSHIPSSIDGPVVYDVFGIVRHLGSDLSNGHYIFDLANPFPKIYKKRMIEDATNEEIKWIRYNDTIANPILPNKVLSETHTPYMFMLHRR